MGCKIPFVLNKLFKLNLVFLNISGGNAFIIDLWGEASDSCVQALYFFATVGSILCVQISKQFLADRGPSFANHVHRINFTVEESITNSTDSKVQNHHNSTKVTFESDVQNVYFIAGTCSIIGSLMLFVSWLHSGCKLCHSPEDGEEEVQGQSSQSTKSESTKKCHMFVATFVLCIISFLGYSNEETFGAFGITFTVNSLHWTTSDASNLMTVFWASVLVCRCVSIVFAKFIKVKKFLIGCTLVSLLGTALMTSMISITPLSLWIGASLLGLGNGNLVANTLNAAKRCSSQTGKVLSVILTSAYTGRIIAPQIVGYLIDNVDPMWFLYLGVVYSGGMFVLSVVFQTVQWCCQDVEKEEQTCEISVATIEIPDV